MKTIISNLKINVMKNEIKENKALSQTSVMPRYFVDERNGCIAIRDRQHPDFDIDCQGLDAELPDVVGFKMGEQIKFSNFITWDLSTEIIKEFKNKCEILNKNNG